MRRPGRGAGFRSSRASQGGPWCTAEAGHRSRRLPVIPRIPHEAYRDTSVKSLAMVPVGTPDPVAAIGAYWASWHRATPAEIEVLSALADGTGLALTNVRLFDELRSSLAREQEARRLAESATAAKDEFLALIAHELRQPLHASLAALRLMKARGSREQGERARAVVERQIGQMTRLVDDLSRGRARRPRRGAPRSPHDPHPGDSAAGGGRPDAARHRAGPRSPASSYPVSRRAWMRMTCGCSRCS